MPHRRSQQPRVQAQRATSRLVRVKGTYVDPVLWTKFNLKLVMENKTLQQWAQEAIEELNNMPLSEIKPVDPAQFVREDPPGPKRPHWVPFRLDPEQYRRARWRWSAMGISMTAWFYARIKDYAGHINLDEVEKAIISREKGQASRNGQEVHLESA
jgi:hypothetical protein